MTHGAGSHTRPEDTSVDVVTDPDGLPELPLLYGGRRGDHVHLDQGANMEGLIATGILLVYWLLSREIKSLFCCS